MNETNKHSSAITLGEQFNYVWITLKEITSWQWEYIRKHRLWTVINNLGENSA